jgi:aryl-alcohol dehydrogenase-like predicted oxidoreductase
LVGLNKLEQISFLTQDTGRTLGQAAIQFILTEPSICSVLPNIYNEQQLREFAAASDTPSLTPSELAILTELHSRNYGVAPAA